MNPVLYLQYFSFIGFSFIRLKMTYISREIQHDRNLKKLQLWSALHYWHLRNVHHLEKKFKSFSWGTRVIVGFHKLTVHWNGANKTSVSTEITKCLQCQQNLQVFCVHSFKTKFFSRCWLIKLLLLPLFCFCWKTTQTSHPAQTVFLRGPWCSSLGKTLFTDHFLQGLKRRFISWRIKICTF